MEKNTFTKESVVLIANSAESEYVSICSKILAETLKRPFTLEDLKLIKTPPPEILDSCNTFINTSLKSHEGEGAEIHG